MATIISTKKTPIAQAKDPVTKPQYRTYGKKEQKNNVPLFRMPNYILMGVGIVIAFIGYILLTGGGSDDPNQFSTDIFDTRRLVVAPITILASLVIEVFAIMLRFPDKKKDNQPAEQ